MLIGGNWRVGRAEGEKILGRRTMDEGRWTERGRESEKSRKWEGEKIGDRSLRTESKGKRK